MYVCYLLLNNVFVSLACFKKSGEFNFTLFAACATSLGQYFPLKNKKKHSKVSAAQTGDLISFFKDGIIWTWTIMFFNIFLVFLVFFPIISKPVHVFLIKVTALTLCSDLQIVMGKNSKPSITAHFANKWQLFTTQYFQLLENNFVYVCVCVYPCVCLIWLSPTAICCLHIWTKWKQWTTKCNQQVSIPHRL